MAYIHNIIVVGAGAAGLMASIWAGRSGANVLLLDGARSLGAKILVSGGGRCNVTHDIVHEKDYCGSTPPAIRKVLQHFTVEQTISFFAELGVSLKHETTGKLFPISDSARTVLDALLNAAHAANVVLKHPVRVDTIHKTVEGFRLVGKNCDLKARRIILATGGKSLPKSGSDGHGFTLATSFGHSLTPHIFPALVALTLADRHFLRALSGVTTDVVLEVRSATGRRLARRKGALLCTHFGISGPATMDISRHWQHAQIDDAQTQLVVNWLPEETVESLDDALKSLNSTSTFRYVSTRLPSRLAQALCENSGIDTTTRENALSRHTRRELVRTLLEMPLPVTGTRGWNHAEVTAGGIPLDELHLNTMESRRCSGLYLCGEMLDVDGYIGGYNFQWAWASGYLAGCAAARSLTAESFTAKGAPT